MSKKKTPANPPALAVARAVAAAMRRLDRRPWTLVRYGDADWTHGYCAGERTGAWRAEARKLARVRPPALLRVPCAQFCVDGARVLVEHSMAEGTGVGAVYELKKAGGVWRIDPVAGGVRWRTFA
ncbi:MAG: hypothetical protein HYY18_21790 [Planctomycetes bacterium]|nr:hypothetical protein [Planctomycetota bacterium]